VSLDSIVPGAALEAIRSNYSTESAASTHTTTVANNDVVVLWFST
jgi:hypothetical protein